MKVFRILAGAALPVALAACGGASRSEFTNSAPTYGALAIAMSASEVQNGMGGVATAVTGQDLVMSLDCHPHLFVRTDLLATRINRHLWKFLRHVEFLIASHPDQLSTGQAVWDRVLGDVEVRLTITKVSDVEFSWLLQMRRVGDPDWTTIFSGGIDRTGATGPHQGKGHAELDLTALKELVLDEPRGMVGVIGAKFETFSDRRLLVVDAVGVNWDFAMDTDLPPALQVPRNAHYVAYREPGKGGSFEAHDQMAFVCPVVADVAPALADVELITRFYRTGDGSVHGRSDALVTGGQLPLHVPPIARVEGVTCSAGAADGADLAERFWLVKGEDASGATVIGWEIPSPAPAGFGPEACDPLLNPPSGDVPDLLDSSHDYDFSAVNFDDDLPAPFPHP